mgnify:CR=1 FL=1
MKKGITIQLDDETIRKIREISNHQQISVSAWIRMLVLKELEKQD